MTEDLWRLARRVMEDLSTLSGLTAAEFRQMVQDKIGAIYDRIMEESIEPLSNQERIVLVMMVLGPSLIDLDAARLRADRMEEVDGES